jgi:aminopeptidase-like protein
MSGPIRISDLETTLAIKNAGNWMHELATQLYPITRSITGDGVRETLRQINAHVPLSTIEVPSGTAVLDWIVPKEWQVRDAYIRRADGEKLIDFQRCNLHLVGYSIPFRGELPFKELRPHLFTLPDRPEWIPYRTSYYVEDWGFCLSHNQLERFAEDEVYDVVVDTALAAGSLTYGELFVPGNSSDEVLISCHICHPSLCNDNLSGIALAALLAAYLKRRKNRLSYRFLFIPGTIGSITWLHTNRNHLANIRHGLVITGVGDPGKLTYKRSRKADAEVDRAVEHVLLHCATPSQVVDFSPYGYDERQYCSPGFNLPVGRLSRTPHGEYPQYHTSADNLDFISAEALRGSLEAVLDVTEILEEDRRYLNQSPFGEPQLGRRGLYATVGGNATQPVNQLALLWVLNLCDGEHSLLDIARRSGLAFAAIRDAAQALEDKGLLTEVEPSRGRVSEISPSAGELRGVGSPESVDAQTDEASHTRR